MIIVQAIRQHNTTQYNRVTHSSPEHEGRYTFKLQIRMFSEHILRILPPNTQETNKNLSSELNKELSLHQGHSKLELVFSFPSDEGVLSISITITMLKFQSYDQNC